MVRRGANVVVQGLPRPGILVIWWRWRMKVEQQDEPIVDEVDARDFY